MLTPISTVHVRVCECVYLWQVSRNRDRENRDSYCQIAINCYMYTPNLHLQAAVLPDSALLPRKRYSEGLPSFLFLQTGFKPSVIHLSGRVREEIQRKRSCMR